MKHLFIITVLTVVYVTGAGQCVLQKSKERLIIQNEFLFSGNNELTKINSLPHNEIKNCKKFHRISFRIGGGPYYHYGIIEIPKRISARLISFQGEGMIGYNFKTELPFVHTAAFFARKGITSSFINPVIIYDQELPYDEFNENKNFNHFEEYEAGLLIGRWFRVSGGIGNQYMYNSTGRMPMFNYYTFTSGFCFGSRNVRWSLNFTAAGGNDYQNIHFRFYSGMNFYLNLLKI